MYARVSRWEGGSADAIRAAAAEMSERAPSGPPEGVPSVGFTLLVDPEGGRSIGIGLFATEEDLKVGDAALNAMDPPGGDMGRRVSVETFEVSVEVRL